MRIRSIAIAAAALAPLGASPLLAQSGYEWDHPDGIGVRYLLYKKMKPREVRPEFEGPHVRAAFVPSDPNDFVRVKGYPLAWGVKVLEFDPDTKAEDEAKTFEDFVHHKDPSLAQSRREVTEDSEANDGLRVWEWYDRYVPLFYALDKRGPGSTRWLENEEWKVRMLAEKTMTFWAADAKKKERFGPSYRGELLPHRDSWIEVEGYTKPLSWSIRVYEFPSPDAGENDPESFAAYLAQRSRSNRTFTVREREQRTRQGTYLRWDYRDDSRNASGAGQVRHLRAAAHGFDEREIALEFQYPTSTEKPDKEMDALADRLIGSLVPYAAAKPKADVGGVYYSVAASRVVDGKEVAVVVDIPVVPGRKPDGALRARATKIVKSLRPESR